jgi:hypothetical protein
VHGKDMSRANALEFVAKAFKAGDLAYGVVDAIVWATDWRRVERELKRRPLPRIWGILQLLTTSWRN